MSKGGGGGGGGLAVSANASVLKQINGIILNLNI